MKTPPAPSDTVPSQVVSLCFFRFGPWRDRAWAFAQMGLARGALKRLPGIGSVKMMGAGTGEGFTPVPERTEISAHDKIFLTKASAGSQQGRQEIRIDATRGEVRVL